MGLFQYLLLPILVFMMLLKHKRLDTFLLNNMRRNAGTTSGRTTEAHKHNLGMSKNGRNNKESFKGIVCSK